jgi:hypothetical protein
MKEEEDSMEDLFLQDIDVEDVVNLVIISKTVPSMM